MSDLQLSVILTEAATKRSEVATQSKDPAFPLPSPDPESGSKIEIIRNRQCSREAPKECSPRRKPWVDSG